MPPGCSLSSMGGSVFSLPPARSPAAAPGGRAVCGGVAGGGVACRAAGSRGGRRVCRGRAVARPRLPRRPPRALSAARPAPFPPPAPLTAAASPAARRVCPATPGALRAGGKGCSLSSVGGSVIMAAWLGGGRVHFCKFTSVTMCTGAGVACLQM